MSESDKSAQGPTSVAPAAAPLPDASAKKETKLNADVKAFVPRATAAVFVPKSPATMAPISQAMPPHGGGGRGGKGYDYYSSSPQYQVCRSKHLEQFSVLFLIDINSQHLTPPF